jgi:hypothetical protein
MKTKRTSSLISLVTFVLGAGFAVAGLSGCDTEGIVPRRRRAATRHQAVMAAPADCSRVAGAAKVDASLVAIRVVMAQADVRRRMAASRFATISITIATEPRTLVR